MKLLIYQESLCVCYTKMVEICYISRWGLPRLYSSGSYEEENIAKNIISSLANLGLDCKNMVGHSYDGASVMEGSFKGVQTLIKKRLPRISMPITAHTIWA